MAKFPDMPDAKSIRSQIKFNTKLNPDVWSGDEMHAEVRLRLLKAAMAFYNFLDVDGLVISDIVVTGSNAAYNYTQLSDIDVHLIVDFATSVCPDLADNLFTTKKALWSATHDVSIHDHPVELYVEDAAKPAIANGRFSILNDIWQHKPEAKPPKPDDAAVVRKTESIAAEIESLLSGHPEISEIETMTARLKTLRQNGLLQGGEFSTENLAYKALRNLGWLDKLWGEKVKRVDAGLSLV